MAGNSNEPGRTVTSKLAAILVAFANGRDFTLSELAMHTNLAMSTVHRLLNDLVRTSLLERPDGITYRPGPCAPRDCRTWSQPPTLRERGALRRRGSRGVAAHHRPPRHRRRPRGRLRREEGPAGAGHAVPQPRTAAPARDGHGQGAARLRTAVADPASCTAAVSPATPPGRCPARSSSSATCRRPARTASHVTDGELASRRRRRGRAGVRRRSGRAVAAVEVDVASPGPGGGRTRATRVADGRTLPAPGAHPHRPLAGRSEPHGRSGSPRGSGPDAGVNDPASDRDVQGDAGAVEGGGDGGPAAIRRSPRR